MIEYRITLESIWRTAQTQQHLTNCIYPGLLEYHDRVANEPRIKAHYANLPEGSLRWTYQPGAFADLV